MAAALVRSSAGHSGSVGCHGVQEGLVLAVTGLDEGGVEGRPGVKRVSRDESEDAYGDIRDVLELQLLQVDAGLVL